MWPEGTHSRFCCLLSHTATNNTTTASTAPTAPTDSFTASGEGDITDASAVAEPDALTYTSAVAEPVARMGVAQFCAGGGLAARRQVPHIQLQVRRRHSDQHRHDDVVHQPP